MSLHAQGVKGEPDAEAALDAPHASFEEFFEAQRDGLFGIMVLVTSNRHQAEEVTQEAFLALWERWDRIRTLENPAGYLVRTAMNLFRKSHRRAATLRRLLPVAGIAHREEAPADAGLMLRETLAALSPRQRAALVCTEMLGYSAQETARILRIRRSTVGALKYQGRAALRKALERTDG